MYFYNRPIIYNLVKQSTKQYIKYNLVTHYRRMSTTQPNKPTIHTTIQSIRDTLRSIRHSNTTMSIGLVPTMGALHDGHIDLVKQSTLNNNISVVSIFVNPTQFSPNEDLSSYPRTLQQDIDILTQHNVQHIFLPDSNIMYPTHDKHNNSIKHKVWVSIDQDCIQGEASSRPTHFKGVLTVVNKLFNIIQPHNVYFGAKDGLQCIVISKMIYDLNIDINMHVVPTHRDSDGLALSSRNVYLTNQQRSQANILYKSLKAAQQAYYDNNMRDVKQLNKVVHNTLSQCKLGNIDYISICSGESGEEVDYDTLHNNARYMVAIAYKLGKPRLIDNCILDSNDHSVRL